MPAPDEARRLVSLFRDSYGKLYPNAVASLDGVLPELFTICLRYFLFIFMW